MEHEITNELRQIYLDEEFFGIKLYAERMRFFAKHRKNNNNKKTNIKINKIPQTNVTIAFVETAFGCNKKAAILKSL